MQKPPNIDYQTSQEKNQALWQARPPTPLPEMMHVVPAKPSPSRAVNRSKSALNKKNANFVPLVLPPTTDDNNPFTLIEKEESVSASQSKSASKSDKNKIVSDAKRIIQHDNVQAPISEELVGKIANELHNEVKKTIANMDASKPQNSIDQSYKEDSEYKRINNQLKRELREEIPMPGSPPVGVPYDISQCNVDTSQEIPKPCLDFIEEEDDEIPPSLSGITQQNSPIEHKQLPRHQMKQENEKLSFNLTSASTTNAPNKVKEEPKAVPVQQQEQKEPAESSGYYEEEDEEEEYYYYSDDDENEQQNTQQPQVKTQQEESKPPATQENAKASVISAMFNKQKSVDSSSSMISNSSQPKKLTLNPFGANISIAPQMPAQSKVEKIPQEMDIFIANNEKDDDDAGYVFDDEDSLTEEEKKKFMLEEFNGAAHPKLNPTFAENEKTLEDGELRFEPPLMTQHHSDDDENFFSDEAFNN